MTRFKATVTRTGSGGRTVESKSYVIVKCPCCKKERKIHAGEIADYDYPFCDNCYIPMEVKKAVGFSIE